MRLHHNLIGEGTGSFLVVRLDDHSVSSGSLKVVDGALSRRTRGLGHRLEDVGLRGTVHSVSDVVSLDVTVLQVWGRRLQW